MLRAEQNTWQGRRCPWTARLPTGSQPVLTHQASHPILTAMDPLLNQLSMDAPTAINLLSGAMNVLNMG
jgi:hypothetical protein